MQNDYISIITPTYNSSLYITDTIQSIISQTYKKWELIIVDDSSIDNTVNIVNQYVAVDKRVKLIQNSKNCGAAFSRNIGLKESKYDYIAFLDSDDIWVKEKLEKQLFFMKKNKIPFSFTGFKIFSNKAKYLGKTVDTTQKGSFSYKDMLAKKATLGCSTVMLNKNSFKGLMQMPLIRTGQDYAFWLKLLKNTDERAHVIPLALTSYRITPNSISRNKFYKAQRQWSIYRENEGLSLLKSCYYFSFYAFRAIFKTK
jgi:teichuronic acid biosynthesis glycosyltransferase TuaG